MEDDSNRVVGMAGGRGRGRGRCETSLLIYGKYRHISTKPVLELWLPVGSSFVARRRNAQRVVTSDVACDFRVAVWQ